MKEQGNEAEKRLKITKKEYFLKKNLFFYGIVYGI